VPAHAKAYRGDFMVYPTRHHVTYTHGPSEASTEYAIAWVTGVTRTGEVRAYVSPTGTPYKGQPVQTLLVRHETLDVGGLKAAIAKRDPYADPFESIDAVKAFVRPFVKS